jgi:hypothetical protein
MANHRFSGSFLLREYIIPYETATYMAIAAIRRGGIAIIGIMVNTQHSFIRVSSINIKK